MNDLQCVAALLCFSFLFGSGTAHSQCNPTWVEDSMFGGCSLEYGSGSCCVNVRAMIEYDDGLGGGPALFVAGGFDMGNGLTLNNIGKWDGEQWHSLGTGALSGVWGGVRAVAVFDEDGNGPQKPFLYVAGELNYAGGASARKIAKWDGVAWSSVGGSITGGPYEVNDTIHSMLVVDEPSGPVLYMGGSMTSIGPLQVNGIAKWDGETWSTVGGGVTPAGVFAMTSFDDGNGTSIYVGGSFTSAGGSPANRIAKWDGSTWASLGSGMDNTVKALCEYDDGTGPALYAGGFFQLAGGLVARSVARWDGRLWSPLPNAPTSPSNYVEDFFAFDDGGGQSLYLAGYFSTSGGQRGVMRWNGEAFEALGSIAPTVYCLLATDYGIGARLFAGGDFDESSLKVVLAEWNGEFWRKPGRGLDNRISAFSVLESNDGQGGVLYAGGSFRHAGDTVLSNIGQWNGQSWTPLSIGMNGQVLALAGIDTPRGSQLFAGGRFTTAGNQSANRVAVWDVNQAYWETLGVGLGIGDLTSNQSVRTLAVRLENGFPVVFAGGFFVQNSEGVVFNHVAQWNGSEWLPMGQGFNAAVDSLALFDDGSGAGEQVYAVGAFTSSGSTPIKAVAKWNGSAWLEVGGGANQPVSELLVFDDGEGPRLFIAGSFSNVGGLAIDNIAKWDGQAWSAVSNIPIPGTIRAIGGGYDRMTGKPLLYLGGAFKLATPFGPANRIAEFDGETWRPLESGVALDLHHNDQVSVHAIATVNETSGPALYVGGAFKTAGATTSHCFAKWDVPHGPSIVKQPEGQLLMIGDPAELLIEAQGAGVLEYQWWKDDRQLVDDGHFSGATTPVLTINAVVPNDKGAYYAIVIDECGTAQSRIALLTVQSQCPSDISPAGGDGQVNVDDLLAIINAWGPCAECPEDIAPQQGNGVVDVDDLLSVINAWGTCD